MDVKTFEDAEQVDAAATIDMELWMDATDAIRKQFCPDYAEAYIDVHEDNHYLEFVDADSGHLKIGPLMEDVRQYIRDNYDIIRGNGQHRKNERARRRKKRKATRRSRRINR